MQLFKFVNDNHISVGMVKVANNPLIAQYDSLLTGRHVKPEDLPAHHRGNLYPSYLPPPPDQDYTCNSYFDTSDAGGNGGAVSDSESLFRARKMSRQGLFCSLTVCTFMYLCKCVHCVTR